MGIIRESCDPGMKFPSSWFFGSDLPVNANILLDDITEHIIIRQSTLLVDYYTSVNSCFTYDEYDQLRQAGLKGMRTGKELRNSFIEMLDAYEKDLSQLR